MSFQDQCKTDHLTCLTAGEGGETVSYSAGGAAAKTITAFINRDPIGLEFYQDGDGEKKIAELEISTDATSGIASPAIGDTATFDSKTWVVNKVQKESIQAAATLTVMLYEISEKSRPDHRIRR